MEKYLTKEAVIEINELALSSEGEKSVLHNKGALVCLEIMQGRFEREQKYEEKIFKKAAYLLERLCQGHAFLDGNKRTSFVATIAFLSNNLEGTYKLPQYDEVVDFLKKIAQGETTFNQIYKWLKSIYMRVD
ncbi:type II toxin-antitoxin system death-on-curing family toxin [Candidatus Micrarchaeota archaeon]|nr:type II toxin-antitoxin system death-on-curing family toxin [Candidatus Micrarchaeota archaeon]